MSKEMTFEQFQATREVCSDLGKVLKDATWDDLPEPATGYLYLECLYIDEVREWWPDAARQAGKWHLLLGRDEYITDDLEALERKLYEFAVSEDYCEGVSTPVAARSERQEGAAKIAAAFRDIAKAARVINEVLLDDDELNDGVPTNWPLNLSADEFAAECDGMAEHYDAEAENDLVYDRKFGNRA